MAEEMGRIQLSRRRTKQVGLLAGMAAFFFTAGIVVLLVGNAPVYVVFSIFAFLGGLAVVLTSVMGFLLRQRASVNRMRTEMNHLSRKLEKSQAAQREMMQHLKALTASQTRLWDDFERSYNPQHTLKK
ncbi:hypothetical protein [Glutamicibacter sp. V16R2B1]|uniref:hypothetical protein n=1 Tax=Glutamicibacter sp. V16R2B1 TaxID=2036207 RepID=UPI0010FEB7DF|nr:hypothetical protein [Glutamicibacter sp. V16R2B1]TLK48792.1 hypothetical protein FDN03_14450 [Glutamicibacter sp. V16R2B1]